MTGRTGSYFGVPTVEYCCVPGGHGPAGCGIWDTPTPTPAPTAVLTYAPTPAPTAWCDARIFDVSPSPAPTAVASVGVVLRFQGAGLTCAQYETGCAAGWVAVEGLCFRNLTVANATLTNDTAPTHETALRRGVVRTLDAVCCTLDGVGVDEDEVGGTACADDGARAAARAARRSPRPGR